MTNYNDGKWHGHNGGECPVHPNSVVEVATAHPNGGMSNGRGALAASEYRWDHTVSIYKIVAFRVVKEYKEPRFFWIVGSTTYPCEDMAIAALNRAYARGLVNEKIIRAREVMV